MLVFAGRINMRLHHVKDQSSSYRCSISWKLGYSPVDIGPGFFGIKIDARNACAWPQCVS